MDVTAARSHVSRFVASECVQTKQPTFVDPLFKVTFGRESKLTKKITFKWAVFVSNWNCA